jgi:hypothetical protein
MPLAIRTLGAKALEFDIRGKLEERDYERVMPMLEGRIDDFGSVDLLIRVSDFAGWTPSAFWEDLKFDVRHFSDVGRLALVGEEPQAKWMALISRPFTGANVRHFPENDLGKARAWVGDTDADSEDEAG